MIPKSAHVTVCALALTAAVAPATAEAHLVATGMGPLCDGIAHFGVSPEDYLPVIVLGFFAGLQGPRQARLTMGALTGTWFVAGLLALSGFTVPAVELSAATALLFSSLGVLLAWNPSSPLWVVLSAGVAIGGVRGLDDLSGAQISPEVVATLGATCACVLGVYALAASVTLPLKRIWMIVAVRVGGSWMAALGILLAGWIIRFGDRLH